MLPNDKYRDMFSDAFMMFAFALGMFVIICKIILIALR
jgi:hypothetical protein